MGDCATRWVVNSEVQAKTIGHKLNLKQIPAQNQFKVFKNEIQTIWLIVSGNGESRTALATAYLNRISYAPKWALWIHIGEGFSICRKTRGVFFIDKVTQQRTGKVFYTGVVIEPNMPRASLLTIDDFALGTDKTDFFDSEAAGFMEVVSKITFREHIIVIKWVSPDLKNVNCQLHKMEAGLLSEKLDNLFNYVEKMQALSMLEKKISLDSKSFLEILKGWNFTATQTYQLRSLIRRWEAKKVRKNPIDEVKNLKNSREVIFILSQILEKHDIDWNEN